MPQPAAGVLLVNLGTPDAPTTPAVRRYLKEFLSDPRVIDIPAAARWLLLRLVILPFRSPVSARAYSKIWSSDGSPLLVHGRALAEAVRARIPGTPVELAMRYGRPSIARGLALLREAGCDRIIVLPLYPQVASSSTGSTLEAVYREAARTWNTPWLSVVPPFYDHPGFIEAFARVAEPVCARARPDRVLMSFHGLPERHVRKSDATGRHCLATEDCCDRIVEANRSCYRAQCFATARALAARLGIEPDRYLVTFQSRLGRTAWIRPYTDATLVALPRQGVRRVLVLCPSFVADCLETLEEIGIRGRETFLASGGEVLELVPSLNAEPAWVETVVALVSGREARSTPRGS